MTLALEWPHGSSSRLSRFDQRWKLASLSLAVMAIALLRSLTPALAAVVAAAVLALVAEIPWNWYWRRMQALAWTLLPFVASILLFVPGDDWRIGAIHLSHAGLTLVLLISAKAYTIVTLVLILCASAPVDQTLKAAHALRCPGLLVHLVVLTYRYLFLLAEDLNLLRIALRVRGFRNRPSVHGYRTVAHVAGALLVRSYERAERVGQAMRCRAFDGHFHSLAEFHTRPADVLAFAAIVLFSVGLLAWDFVLR